MKLVDQLVQLLLYLQACTNCLYDSKGRPAKGSHVRFSAGQAYKKYEMWEI